MASQDTHPRSRLARLGIRWFPRWSHKLPGEFTVTPLNFRCMMAEIVGFNFERRRCCAGQARQARTLSPSAVLPAQRIRPCASDLPLWPRKSVHAISSHQMCSAPCRRPKSKSGGYRQSGEIKAERIAGRRLPLWHFRDITRSQIRFRFRRKSGHAAGRRTMTGLGPMLSKKGDISRQLV